MPYTSGLKFYYYNIENIDPRIGRGRTWKSLSLFYLSYSQVSNVVF